MHEEEEEGEEWMVLAMLWMVLTSTDVGDIRIKMLKKL